MKNCWEMINCSKEIREECIVFKSSLGKDCFYMMNIKKGCPAAKEYGSCFNCPVYKANNQD